MYIQEADTRDALLLWKKTVERDLFNKKVAVKINYQSSPRPGSPRTDMDLLACVLDALLGLECEVTIIEGASGKLFELLSQSSISSYLLNDRIDAIDVDLLDNVELICQRGRLYPIPTILQQFDSRIAVPNASKRSGYLFSCNVKTFVGLLPRKLCDSKRQGLSSFSRPMIHEDLDETVADLFFVVQDYAPFSFFINGGRTFSEYSSICDFKKCLISDDPVKLDRIIADWLCAPVPQYLQLVESVVTQDDRVFVGIE